MRETNFYQNEIRTVLDHQKNSVLPSEAESIVENRMCRVVIFFDMQIYRWKLNIFRLDRLIYTKSASFSNQQGVVSGIWKFTNPSDKIPWTSIMHGEVWSCTDVIIEYLFWLKLSDESVSAVRDLLLLKPVNANIH